MNEQTRIELEAAAFRGLIKHLQKRTDAQNIDIMNLAGFCRNCLSKWYKAEADARGIELSYDSAREVIYGMPYNIWKTVHQKKASDEQMQKFEETKPLHASISGPK
ncbi:MAG: alkaline phosphatase [Rhodospirillaceae bacterium TMED8]|nr:alkaline phosphatase [Magnetovibrio sp.]OUT52214.1 MAG: alkaline phosphatase [Rhodospirillaceae bacterium TMED8]|tara:strand:- start:1182 stop:1499 length:318 start_codon:yes stop_codon:yes gene_type:complete